MAGIVNPLAPTLSGALGMFTAVIKDWSLELRRFVRALKGVKLPNYRFPPA